MEDVSLTCSRVELGKMELMNKHLFLMFLGFLFLGAHMVHGDVKYYDFVLHETEFTRLCSTKTMLTVNGSFPGPVIRVHKGDTVYVNVHNQGYYGVTIHWHGVKQPRNPWSDGPEYVTQCPIQPGSNFTYEVIFSTEEGTVWWHAHSDWTRFSVHGAIVVLPAVGTTYPFPQPDAEEVIVLATWFKEDVMEVLEMALKYGTDTPRSDAFTINGQPGDFCNCSKDSTYRWVVDYGKTYLVRLVNAASNSELFFAIAQHMLTVVGIDGAYIKPIHTSNIMISPGETMDVLVTANQTPGEYYIATRAFFTETIGTTFDEANTTAIMQYSGNYTSSSPEFPSTLPYYHNFEAANNFTNSIRSLANEAYPINVPLNITTRMYVTVETNNIICAFNSCHHGAQDTNLAASLNNISFTNPTTDVLLAYYRNLSGYYTADFPDQPPSYFNFTAEDLPNNTEVASQGTKVKVLNYNENVELIFQGTNVLSGSQNHPMHLHGHSFYVVGSGIGNFDPENDPKRYNLVDPPEVNTFSVPKMGWLTVRFKAKNPGVWLWHCHFDRHLVWGMNTAFIVKDGGTPETSILDPPSGLPPCMDPFTTRVQELINAKERARKIEEDITSLFNIMI